MTYLRLLVTSQFREHRSYALAFSISDCTKTIAGKCAHHETRDICDNESYPASRNSPEPGPPRRVAFDFRTEKL